MLRYVSIQLLPAAVLMTLTCGCVVPIFVGNDHISEGLASRVGHALGPDKSPCDIVIDDALDLEDGLSEEEAVTLGIWNNPSFQELLADLSITQADLIQASQIQNPDITTLFPLAAKQWEFTLMLPLDVMVLQPRRVAAAHLEQHRVAERLVQDGLNVVRDIRNGYVDFVQAKQAMELATRGATLRNDIAGIAEARLQVGAVSELDASALRLEALFGNQQVIQATQNHELARENLRFLLGIQLADIDLTTSSIESEIPPLDVDAEGLVGEALSSRPDLRALEIAYAAACQRAQLTRYDYLGLRAILPDINSQGEKGFEAGPGVRFNLPIFHQNQGATAQALAQMERIGRQYARQRDTVSLEVRQAATQLLRTQEVLHVWRDQIVPQAETAVVAARDGLEEDRVSLLLVLETTRQLLNALQQELQAAAALRRAIAELERSVGRRLLDGLVIEDHREDIPPPRPPNNHGESTP